MSDSAPALHAAKCSKDGCEWNTVAFDMIEIYGQLEDHLKEEHGYSQEQWRETREELAQ